MDRHPNPLCSYSHGAGEGTCVQTPVWRLLIDGRPVGDYCFQHKADMDEREEWIYRAKIFPPGEREWLRPAADALVGE